MMKIKSLFVLFMVYCGPAILFAQQTSDSQTGNTSLSTPVKIALVIGNSAYIGLTPLANPVNDANDIAAALEALGFAVDKILNGSLDQMENAVENLKERLSATDGAYGFFFYAGHGVQSGGENYLIPVDANILNENYLRTRAVSVQTLLDDLNDARNGLNVVVLDACRDNPFGWGRSAAGRGLAIVTRQPADSIIVYATSAGQQASDGEGRNGLFTSRLLPNLLTPGLEVSEVFKRTGADVAEVSQRRQIPAIYNQFFGTAYLGDVNEQALAGAYVPGTARPVPLPSPGAPGKAERTPEETARLWTVGASVGSALADPRLVGTVRGTIAPFKNVFIEPGIDLGLLSGGTDTGYYHVYPYVHAAYYYPLPFKDSGIYAGVGGGYLIGRYDFPEGQYKINTFSIDVVVGGNILSFLDLSYTFKTNFDNFGHKISVGYVYRFR